MTYLTRYALSFLRTPYKWGGDDFSGFDCSGFVLELLEAGGLKLSDKTAHQLYHYMMHEGFPLDKPREGAIVFFGSKQKVTHTAYCVDGEFIIEAGGGGRKTTSRAAAIRDNAWIRLRRYEYRSDLVAIRYPQYQ